MSSFFSNGLIGHKVANSEGYFDFGDCSAECGRYWFGLNLTDPTGWPNNTYHDWMIAISKLEIDSSGVWRRHPNQYNEPEDYSRDQQLSIQCTLAVHGQIETLKRMLFKQWKHFGKYQNKDFRTYEWTIDFRCLNYWWMYPLICILDLGVLINVLLESLLGKIYPDRVSDCLNTFVVAKFCGDLKYRTPLSIFALWLYPKIRNLEYAWNWYYRHPENPPINELYRSLWKKKKN